MPVNVLSAKLHEAELCVNGGDSLKAEQLTGEVLLELGFDQDILNESINVPDGALEQDEKQQMKYIYARALHILGTAAWRKGEYSQAIEYCTNALSVFEMCGAPADVAKTKRSLGNIYVHLSDYPQALELYIQALKNFEEAGDSAELAGTNCNIGIIYADMSDFPQAYEYYKRALSYAEDSGHRTFAANITTNIGALFQDIADYSQAIEYFQKALDLYTQLNNRIGIAITLCNIGLLYTSLSDSAQALEHFHSALAIYKDLGNEDGIARLYGNIGITYYENKEYSQAMDYFMQGLELYSKHKNGRSMAINLNNIGNVYREIADFPRALEYYHKAHEITQQLGMKHSRSDWLKQIAHIYSRPEFVGADPAKAKDYLLEALDINIHLGTLNKNAAILKNLAECFEANKQWEEANTYHKRYFEVFKAVQSDETVRQLQLFDHRRKIEEAERDRQLKIARHEVTVNLLHKTLPPSIAERLIAGENTIADKFESISILFADIVGFTPLAARTEPKKMVELLNNLFTRFDKLTLEYRVERVKTIGDAYMVVSGAPETCDDHAVRIANFALAMLDETAKFSNEMGEHIRIRIGINCGEAVGAVVGETKFSYDLWGDAVNTASRMESHGEAGRIHVSEEFMRAVGAAQEQHLRCIERGEIEVKGKGMMTTYFLEEA